MDFYANSKEELVEKLRKTFVRIMYAVNNTPVGVAFGIKATVRGVRKIETYEQDNQKTSRV